MYLKPAFSALLFILSVNIFAQQNHFCINDQIQLKEKKEINISLDIPEPSGNVSTKYVNTVVHVIYYNNTDSIPSETIEAVIEDLNRLFRAEGIDTSLVTPVHRDKLMDSQIQFCLAETDPNGMPTTGITHTQTIINGFPVSFSGGSFLAELAESGSVGAPPWDIDSYFNIWIAPIGQNGENFSYGVPREEYFPLNALTPANAIPGALVDVENFSTPPANGSLEGLFAHECGHALGLLHTYHFTDTSSTGTIGFCDGSDFMDDTPAAWITTDCDPTIIVNTCTDSLNDEPDNVTNFMNNACMLMFTPDQIANMHNNLSLAPSGLLEGAVCETISSIEKNRQRFNIEFNISPNPNNGNFVVKFQQPYFSKGILSIYNSMGQNVFEKNIDLNNSLSFQIDRYGLEKGIYYLSVKSGQGVFSKKVVVQMD